MPTHEPKFEYSIPAVKSYNKFYKDDHIYVIFSSDRERDLFTSLIGDIPFRPLIYNFEEDGASHIINGKMIYGLKKIFETTEFDKIAMIDSEILFYRNMDYDRLFSEHVDSKTVYANRILPNTPKLYCLIEGYPFFNQQDQAKVKNVLLQDELFFFFNNIPIYYKPRFEEFLNYINYDESKKRLSYHTFIYMMYVYYLIIKDMVTIEILNYKGNNYYKINNEPCC
jgi:hypothetical protein